MPSRTRSHRSECTLSREARCASNIAGYCWAYEGAVAGCWADRTDRPNQRLPAAKNSRRLHRLNAGVIGLLQFGFSCRARACISPEVVELARVRFQIIQLSRAGRLTGLGRTLRALKKGDGEGFEV